MKTLTLVGKPDCHLCHVMLEVVKRVVGERAVIEHQDVRSDPTIFERYRHDIPVLFAGSEEIARHRVDEATLRERLETSGIL